VRSGQVTVFRRQNSTAVFDNWAPLQSVIRILRASLAQIDTEMARNTLNWPRNTSNNLKQGKVAKLRSVYDIRERNPVPDYDPDRAQKLISSSTSSMSRHLSRR